MSGLVSRQLSFIFKLGIVPAPDNQPVVQRTFSNGSTTLQLNGFAAAASISKEGSFSMAQAELQIYGMSLSDMNQIASFGQPLYTLNYNSVTVLAGDPTSGLSTVFEGNISEAAIDFSEAPNVAFNVSAASGLLAALTDASPSSYIGPTDAAMIIQDLSGQMGLIFENNGASAILNNPYFSGSLLQQVEECAAHVQFNFSIDNGVLAIWPKDGFRQTGTPTIVSPGTGLVGYPTYTAFGVEFKTLYNPTLKYGAQITMQSSLQQACGKWIVYSLYHSLSAQIPDGDWFSDVLTAKVGAVPYLVS